MIVICKGSYSIGVPIKFCCKRHRRGSIARLKRMGDTGLPWRTPLRSGKEPVVDSDPTDLAGRYQHKEGRHARSKPHMTEHLANISVGDSVKCFVKVGHKNGSFRCRSIIFRTRFLNKVDKGACFHKIFVHTSVAHEAPLIRTNKSINNRLYPGISSLANKVVPSCDVLHIQQHLVLPEGPVTNTQPPIPGTHSQLSEVLMHLPGSSGSSHGMQSRT